jgi:conjugative transfer region protein TrbK
MRRSPADFGAFGRALGLVAVAAIVVATAICIHDEEKPTREPPPVPSAISDPLTRELARCQAIGMAAEDDTDCKAAWAENRRRFFALPPANASSADPTSEQKTPARAEDR